MVYGDDENFTKFGRHRPHRPAGDEKFEFIYENDGTPRNDAARLDRQPAGGLPERLLGPDRRPTGPTSPAQYSIDGTDWTPVGRPAPLPADAKIGLFAFSNDGRRAPDRRRSTRSRSRVTGSAAAAARPARAATTSSTAAASTRRAGTRSCATTRRSTRSAGGKLTITTEPGDIYTGDTNPPPNNFILQSADHAGDDWVIETKLDGATINGGYAQGGLMAYVDGDNYVKFDAISDAGQTRINRLELRSEIGGRDPGPTPAGPAGAGGHDRDLAAADQDRRDATPASTRSTARRGAPCAAPVTNADGGAGLRPVRVRPAGRRPGRHGAVRLLHARRRGPAASASAQRSGDEFDGARPRQDEVERDRPRGRHEVRARGRRAAGHDRRRATSTPAPTRRRTRATSSCRRPTTPAPTG